MISRKLPVSKILITLLLSSLFLLAACSSSDENKEVHNFQYKAALNPFSSCDELSDYLLETAKQQEDLYYYIDTFESVDPSLQASPVTSSNDTVSGSSDALSSTTDSAAQIVDHTTTNNQIDGVDEADFVKTDGEYSYIATGGYFVIFDNWPAAQSKELARIKLTGSTADLFIYKDMVWVVSQVYGVNEFNTITDVSFAPRVYSSTVISLFDVSDRSNPQLIRESVVEGYYVAARRIANRIHMVTSASLDLYPFIDSQETFNINDLLPVLTDSLVVENETTTTTDLISSCENIYRPETANGTSTLSLLSYDLDEPLSAIKRQTIISNSGLVYANEKSLYIATTEDYRWLWLPVQEGDSSPNPGTTFYKFDLTDEPAYVASGRVDGYLINQFAMDEYDDQLRAVTTVSRWWSNEPPINSLYILQQSGNDLIQRSVLSDLGKEGEWIYAARFMGEKAFLVTFQQTDPLYTLDLSDADNPRVAGELEVPGFSTYLHPLEGDLLLALGRSGSNNSIDLSLFDISDFSNPSLLFRESVGDGSYTGAQYDHKAFTFFAQENLIALPVTRWQGDYDEDGQYISDVFNGLMLYKVDNETGFEHIGDVDHSDLYQKDANNQWYYPESIRRSFFNIDEDQNTYLYSISSRGFKVNALLDLEPLATLPLPVYDWQDDLNYWLD